MGFFQPRSDSPSLHLGLLTHLDSFSIITQITMLITIISHYSKVKALHIAIQSWCLLLLENDRWKIQCNVGIYLSCDSLKVGKL